jgi:hypothetical protein
LSRQDKHLPEAATLADLRADLSLTIKAPLESMQKQPVHFRNLHRMATRNAPKMQFSRVRKRIVDPFTGRAVNYSIFSGVKAAEQIDQEKSTLERSARHRKLHP